MKTRTPYLLFLGLLLANFATAQFTITYLETFNFDQSESANDTTSTAGWAGGYPGANSDTTLRAANWYDVSPGKREISTGINNNQLGTHTNAGSIVQSTDPSWVQFYTTEYTVGTDFSQLARLEFDVLNDQMLRAYYLTVEAGGQWYITSDSFQTPNFGQQWYTQQGLDLSGVAWYEWGSGEIAQPPAPDFSVTGSPSGEVTGFGFLYNMFGQGNVVVDNYTAYVVPEPATVSLLLGLGCLGFTIWHRK